MFGNKPNKNLIKAAQNNDVQGMKQALADGANLTKCGPKALNYAIVPNAKDAVRFLLEHNVDMTYRNTSNNTALHLAAYNDNVEMAELLLDAGADINILKGSFTPLGIAAYQNKQKILSFLIERGADVDKTYSSYTPLHRAVESDNFEVVKMLVEGGADLNSLYSKETPLYRAIYHDRETIALYLIEQGADVNIRYSSSTTALFWALYHGRSQRIIKALLQNGADLNEDQTYSGDSVSKRLIDLPGIDINDISKWQYENSQKSSESDSKAENNKTSGWHKLSGSQIIRFSPWTQGQRLQEIFDFAAERIERILETQPTSTLHRLDPIYFNQLASMVEVEKAGEELKKQGGSPDILKTKKPGTAVNPAA